MQGLGLPPAPRESRLFDAPSVILTRKLLSPLHAQRPRLVDHELVLHCAARALFVCKFAAALNEGMKRSRTVWAHTAAAYFFRQLSGDQLG